MQIRKTYQEVNPELLFYEVRDLARKQGATVGETKLETYSVPTDSSSQITRATLTLKVADEAGKADREFCLVHVVGSAKGETKLIIDLDDRLFSQPKIASLQSDLDFVFGSYELRQS